jgi:hypothetical protein
MKPQIALAFVVATAPAAWAQTTGISQPPDESQTVSAPEQPKPSAAIPYTPVAPVSPPAALPAPTAAAQPSDEQFKPYTGPAVSLHTHAQPEVDPDAGVVTEVARNPNELAIGTTIHARLRNSITTENTQPNTPFTAELSEAVVDGNRVVLPIGSVIEGTVTQARGGKRFHGAALIHLQAQRVVLPDGTFMPLHAQVIDTDQFAETRIDNEGNIIRKDHAKATLAVVSLATGTGAVAGAMLGGGVGALVGAGIGAGLSTAVWLKADRQARLPQDSLVVFSLTDPVQLKSQPDFAINPSVTPHTTTATSTPPAPAYVAPQAFVPTN